ncbi:MAG: LemA family protein [Deltaproteobacteria bacterium]|nr:LemA family protein [Deltaproteobacteria bacterium]
MATHPGIAEVPARRRTSGRWILVGLAIALLLLALSTVGTYNRLVTLDQAVRAQWGQVENVYQRRADLVPNLVQTVKGAAAFERETFTAVTEARARVGQVSESAAGRAVDDPAAFQRFEEAQQGLSSALSRLLVVVERYPELRATQSFRDLQSQLEGTENRITVERMRFNDAAREFNSTRSRFPAVLVANFFGGRFRDKSYFAARPGAATPPEVRF